MVTWLKWLSEVGTTIKLWHSKVLSGEVWLQSTRIMLNINFVSVKHLLISDMMFWFQLCITRLMSCLSLIFLGYMEIWFCLRYMVYVLSFRKSVFLEKYGLFFLQFRYKLLSSKAEEAVSLCFSTWTNTASLGWNICIWLF